MTTAAVSDAQIRRFLWDRQALDGGLLGLPPSAALLASGWSRSVGGVGPYLAIHARTGASRAQIDADVAALALHELPSARGCTYVVPADDFALALRAGQGHTDAAQVAQAKKHCGVTDAELERLQRAILDALQAGDADPDELKLRCGDAVRHLGDVGKKRGLTTTLALGLGHLQQHGLIRRVPVTGRLDQQRYRYALWPSRPLAGCSWTDDELSVALGRRYFAWAAPATAAQFAWWAGRGVKAARVAVSELGLVPIASGDDRLINPSELDALHAERAPASRVVLTGSIDNLVHLRRDVAVTLGLTGVASPLLSDAALQTLGGLSDLPHHAIVHGGELIGLWDYDPDAGAIVWCTFEPPTDAVRAAVAETEAFVRDELGDARCFSLDSPKSRAPRLASLRAAAHP